MNTQEKINAMYEFEKAINKFTQQLEDHANECLQRRDRQWDQAYTAWKLAQGLAYTKLAISELLEQSMKQEKAVK